MGGEARHDCARAFENDAGTKWADVVRKANRIGDAFRGIVRAQGRLGFRHLSKATGDHQDSLPAESQGIPKELYQVQVAEQMKEWQPSRSGSSRTSAEATTRG